MTITKLNALDKTDTETISAFRFVFIDSLIVSASQVAGDHANSRQKKARVAFGLPYLFIDLLTGVWSRENKSLPKFLVCIDTNQIYTMRKLRDQWLLQWNLDLTKCQGTGEICSLNRGFDLPPRVTKMFVILRYI